MESKENYLYVQKGMTLIEVIIGIAIFGLMLLLVINALHMAAKSWKILETYSDVHETRRLGLGFIQRQIYQAIPLVWKDTAGESLVFIGSEDRLDFISRLPSHFGENGMKLVSFYIVTDSQGVKLVFGYRSLQPDTSPINLLGGYYEETVTILDNISDINIAYLGEVNINNQLEWQSVWKDEKLLPNLVRLRVKYQQDEQWQELKYPIFAQVQETLPQLTITQPGVEPPSAKRFDSDMEFF